MIIYNAVDEHGIDHVPVYGDAPVFVVTYIVKLIFEIRSKFKC